MKKMSLLFLIVLFFSLVSCGGDPSGNGGEGETPTPKTKLIISGDNKISDTAVLECKNEKGEVVDVIWESSDDDIAFIDEDGMVIKMMYGKCQIIAIEKSDLENKAYFDIELLPNDEDIAKAFKEIEAFVRANTPSSTDDDVEFIESYDKYDATISYKSFNEEIITSDGKITRTIENQYVSVKVDVALFDEVNSFTIMIEVARYPIEEQIAQVKAYLDSKVLPVLEDEYGFLPSTEEVYGKDITWVTDYPYIIDAHLCLHKAYESKEINLIAKVKIGGEDKELKYKYTSKGVAEMEKDKYIDEILTNLIPSVAGKIVNIAYTGQIDIIEDLIYPDEANQIRPSGATSHEGMKMPGGVQWIVIHDTGMTHPNDNAARLNRYIHAQASNDYSELYDDEMMRTASWHFSIDDKEIYQHVPTDEVAWHAGDGSTVYPNTWVNNGLLCLGGGNRNGIGIETCINPENDYILTLKRTSRLVATLLDKYNLGIDRIKQHYNFSGKNCPNIIRTYKYWDEFIKETEFQYWIIKTGITLECNWEIDKPDIINYSGKVFPTDKEETVNITLKATINGVEKVYNYTTKVMPK